MPRGRVPAAEIFDFSFWEPKTLKKIFACTAGAIIPITQNPESFLRLRRAINLTAFAFAAISHDFIRHSLSQTRLRSTTHFIYTCGIK